MYPLHPLLVDELVEGQAHCADKAVELAVVFRAPYGNVGGLAEHVLAVVSTAYGVIEAAAAVATRDVDRPSVSGAQGVEYVVDQQFETTYLVSVRGVVDM